MSEQLYRVAARSRLTDWSGFGSPTTKELAEAWAKHGNDTYPEIEHWAEPVEHESDLEEAR